MNKMLIVNVSLSCTGDTETTNDTDLSADRLSRYDMSEVVLFISKMVHSNSHVYSRYIFVSHVDFS